MTRAVRTSVLLTKREREVLTIMADHRDDEAGEIVYERGTAYLGDTRIAARTVFALIRLYAISANNPDPRMVEYYRINETGLKLIGRKP